MRIPGIPGASEPAFQTRDQGWLPLDLLIRETVLLLGDGGDDVSLVAVKRTVQIARHVLTVRDDVAGADLIEDVCARLRRSMVVLPAPLVGRILDAYARIVQRYDITGVHEIGT